MSSIKVLDLFSGIGGFSHGFEKAGNFETVAFCEIDPHAQKVLKKNFPGVPIFEDISLLSKGKLIAEAAACKIDVICGGFPCQDISIAGKQRGINEQTRSGLWIEYKRLIKEIKPRWVVIENVRNLLSNGLAIVLQDLHEIGYDAEWEIISARAVGACHLRERAWIVAYPNSQSLRVKPEWTEEGRNCLQQSKEAEFGYDGKERNTKSSDSGSFGLIQCQGQPEEIQSRGDKKLQRETGKQPSLPESLHSFNEIQSADSSSERLQGVRSSGLEVPASLGEEVPTRRSSEIESNSVSDSDYFRFWPAFATEEEKQEWWAKATSGIRDWWEVESTICRVDDGLPSRLDKGRAQRIKQLGNSIVPGIAQIIGDRILYHEAVNKL